MQSILTLHCQNSHFLLTVSNERKRSKMSIFLFPEVNEDGKCDTCGKMFSRKWCLSNHKKIKGKCDATIKNV